MCFRNEIPIELVELYYYSRVMVERNRKHEARIAIENKEAAADLKRKGWQSTADLPYAIEQSIKRSAGTIAAYFPRFLGQTLARKSDEYGKEHIKKIGVKTFVSPDLAREIEEEVKKFYRITH